MELKQDETGKAIVPVLSCVLKQLCDRNDRLPVNGKTVSKFHAQRPPAISISDYLLRIAKYALCSGECFVLALVYIDRIIQQNPTFVVNSLNIHRLLITSVMLAAKFFDDQYFNNAYYAKVGGVPANEMNSLEVEFLFMTNFNLFVTTETYKQYYQELWNHANSNSACGCSASKVPPLVLSFEREERERRKRIKLLKQMRAKASEEDIEGGDAPADEDAPSATVLIGEPDAMIDSPVSRSQAVPGQNGQRQPLARPRPDREREQWEREQRALSSSGEGGGGGSLSQRSGRRPHQMGQGPGMVTGHSPPVGVN